MQSRTIAQKLVLFDFNHGQLVILTDSLDSTTSPMFLFNRNCNSLALLFYWCINRVLRHAHPELVFFARYGGVRQQFYDLRCFRWSG